MNRPVGVVLTAILLGLLAAFLLLGMAFMVLTGFLALHGMAGSQSPSPLPPSLIPILFFGMSLACDALAVWLILTLVGLIRLRSWARYSVLVIAALMAGFGAVSAVTFVAMPFLMPNQPGTEPQTVHAMFFVIAAVYAVFALLGVVLLVYYNFPTTRAIFPQSATLDPPNTSTGRPRPTAVTVISWIYLICGPFSLLYLFLPMPTFLFGFIFSGVKAHVLYIVIALVTVAIGYGLLRLRNSARLAVFWWSAVCPVNILVLLTPWGKRQFNEYMAIVNSFNTRYFPAQPTPTPNFAASPAAIIVFSLMAMVCIGVVLWFLHRHRVAFTPLPSSPLAPGIPEPTVG